MEYAPWKRALSIETENLQLTSTQQLQLLEVRTELEPLQMIKEHKYVQIELGPNIALEMVWDSLDKTYHTPHSPSQHLLQKLTQGPHIKLEDATSLINLSIQCQSAQRLYLTNRNALPSLQEQGTLDAIVNRLDIMLRREWYAFRRTLNERAEAPSFHDFVDWISEQTDMARYERNARPHKFSQSYPDTSSNNKRPQSFHHPTNPPTSPAQQNLQHKEDQKSIPGGDKEYRDTLRRRRGPPNSPTLERNMHTGDSIATRSHNNSPKVSERWCAWCSENGQAHNHSTPTCYMLKNANAEDQWKVVNKHRICDSCLLPGHHWKNCPTNRQQRCPDCQNSHHPNLGCIPNRRASTYPTAD